MLGRVGFLLAASIAAYAVKRPRTPRVKPPSGNGDDTSASAEIEPDKREQNQDSSTSYGEEYAEEEEKEEEEEEEVKTISSFIGATLPSNAAHDKHDGDEEEELLPEFESLLSGEIDFPLPDNKYDTEEMANNALELERLRSLVKDFEEREVKLEGELLEYYGLKEQETEFTDLQKQLKIKAAEVNMLNATIGSLQAERKKLQEEVAVGVAARKELEVARNKIKELQRQIQLDAGQTKGQLLLLKQQVTGLKEKEEEAARKDAELGRKLKAVRDLEVEVVELRRKNKELQHEKRDLSVKLAAAEARANELSNMNETEMVARAREEISNLRHANEDLTKQVEGLQINRFSEVEELVYLRWVNACLRFELRNYQAPSGKVSARDLSKSLSPRSQERAKRLMTEYAGSERGQGDTDLESVSSMPSSPGSEDFDNASIDSSTSRYSFMSKKPNLIQKLKRWGKSKDDSSVLASPVRSFGSSSSPMRISTSQRPAKGPLEALMLRNAGDYNAITTYGNKESDLADDANLPRVRTRVASNDSLNNVAASFQLMSKSVERVADDKYPAFKDRHKLALEREQEIKEKAEQARAARLTERDRAALPPKLMQIKEKPIVVANTRAGAGAGAGAGAENDSQSGNGGDSKAATMQVVSKMRLTEIEKRAPRVPKPPPQPSKGSSTTAKSGANISTGPGGLPPPPPPPPGAPPPPPGGPPRPPPPPGSLSKGTGGGAGVHRAPELVELYQSLMKRESKKDPASMASSGTSAAVADARNNMIGEIANKSTFMLAVKADVETQGDFVQSLASEVRSASFTDIEDLVSFVNWLDEELSFLVDERAVLKHFDWPEGKADALREAAFEYQDLMKLERQVTNFVDDPKLPCEAALKKMYSLLEKVEQSVYALLRTRDMAMSRYRDFGIPVDWLSDSGVVGKIKLSCVQLARKYMKRVSTELDALSGTEKEPNREFLLLQGVRFAFRVHQFSGGFDAESMRAFEELRSRVNSQEQPTTGVKQLSQIETTE